MGGKPKAPGGRQLSEAICSLWTISHQLWIVLAYAKSVKCQWISEFFISYYSLLFCVIPIIMIVVYNNHTFKIIFAGVPILMAERKMIPILKWAGGKTQLLTNINARMPDTYNRYFEPFIGGGAVLFSIAPTHAYINDINQQLINLYHQLQIRSSEVIKFVNELDAISCDKERFYSIRERYNEKITEGIFDAECAALMIWINKHCFNGLYRVNGKGLFNVPYNNKVAGKSIDEENVYSISTYLQQSNTVISCVDFEPFCENVQANDFVYFDSPYVPESDTANFTDYTKDGFTLADHERLAALFRRLDKRGAKLLLSNNDVPLVHSLYQGYNIQSVDVKRMINRNASKRFGREVLITNY